MVTKRTARWELESEDIAANLLRRYPEITQSVLSGLRGEGNIRKLVGARDLPVFKKFTLRDTHCGKGVSVEVEFTRSRIVSGKVVDKKVPIFSIAIELGHHPGHAAAWENRVGKLRIARKDDGEVDPKEQSAMKAKVLELLPLWFSQMRYAHLPEEHQRDLQYAGDRLKKWLERLR